METVKEIIVWLKANWDSVLTLWACVIGAAEIVVKWTDSQKDDAVLGKVCSADGLFRARENLVQ